MQSFSKKLDMIHDSSMKVLEHVAGRRYY